MTDHGRVGLSIDALTSGEWPRRKRGNEECKGKSARSGLCSRGNPVYIFTRHAWIRVSPCLNLAVQHLRCMYVLDYRQMQTANPRVSNEFSNSISSQAKRRAGKFYFALLTLAFSSTISRSASSCRLDRANFRV